MSVDEIPDLTADVFKFNNIYRRRFGDIPEKATEEMKCFYDVLPPQPRLASVCRNVPEQRQPYRSPSPRADEVH